jgi:hypothetical protein
MVCMCEKEGLCVGNILYNIVEEHFRISIAPVQSWGGLLVYSKRQWGALVIRHGRQYIPKQSGLNCLVEAIPILRLIE